MSQITGGSSEVGMQNLLSRQVAENFRGDAEKKCSMSGGEFMIRVCSRIIW